MTGTGKDQQVLPPFAGRGRPAGWRWPPALSRPGRQWRRRARSPPPSRRHPFSAACTGAGPRIDWSPEWGART